MARAPQRYGDGRGELVVVLDCSDVERSAAYWAAALGYVRADGDSTYVTLVPSDGVGVELLLQRVPDAKTTKNRVHLDLRTRDLDGEVSRISALGGTLLTDKPYEEDGWVWYLLGDPDGNELCVLRPPDDYWA